MLRIATPCVCVFCVCARACVCVVLGVFTPTFKYTPETGILIINYFIYTSIYMI